MTKDFPEIERSENGIPLVQNITFVCINDGDIELNFLNNKGQLTGMATRDFLFQLKIRDIHPCLIRSVKLPTLMSAGADVVRLEVSLFVPKGFDINKYLDIITEYSEPEEIIVKEKELPDMVMFKGE